MLPTRVSDMQMFLNVSTHIQMGTAGTYYMKKINVLGVVQRLEKLSEVKCENPPSSEVLTCPRLTQQPQIFALVTEAQR